MAVFDAVQNSSNITCVFWYTVDTYLDFLKCSLGSLSGVMSRNMLYVVIIVDYQAINVVFIKAFKIATKVWISSEVI